MASLKTKFFSLARSVGVGSALVVALWLTMAIASPAQSFNTLVGFDGTNGGMPGYFPLVQGEDGNLYGTTSAGGDGTLGTVCKITPDGNLTTLYSFCGGNHACSYGVNPQALVLSTNGNFYGTTWGSGGIWDISTIFTITAAGTLSARYNFCLSGWPCDGAYNPTSALIQATNGIFYGTTWGGGANDAGTVFQTSSRANAVRKLHSFCSQPNCADGSNSIAGLVQANDGNLYGTTYSGGTQNAGTVFKITAGGKLTTLYDFCALANCADGANPWAGLIQANDGNLYGTTYAGGAVGYGTVFKITSSGALTALHSFDGADGARPQGGLVQASDGNFYGTTSEGGSSGSGCGGSGCGTVFEITPSGTLTTLHSFDGTDGNDPQGGLVQNTNGNFYGTTSSGDLTCYYLGCGTVFSLSMGLGPFVSLLPTTGKVEQTVGILGQGFNTTTSVMFGSGSASFTIVADTYLTAVVPAEGTTGFVTVTTSAGPLTSNKTFKLVPNIAGFNPPSGPVGTQVTITGGGFNGATKVTIGGAKAAFTVNSGSQITATVSARAKTGKIRVTTAGGTATSKGTFTVT